MAKQRTVFICFLMALVMQGIVGSGFAAAPAQTGTGGGQEVILHQISFYKADLVAVLQQLAADCGYNVIIAPEVKGTVTISLTGVTFEEALKTIIQNHGLAYQREGRNFWIGPPGKIQADQESFGYFHVKYADVKQVADLVQKLNIPAVTWADERTRRLVALGSPATLQRISQVLNMVDLKMPQVNLEVKVIETSSSALKELGANYGYKNSSFDWGVDSSAAKMILDLTTNGHSWTAEIAALISKGQARLVSAPSITAIDGKTASIMIGDQIPIETTDKDAEGDIEKTVTYKDVGVKLNFTPRIQQNDELQLDFKTEVSSLGEKMGENYKIGTREATSCLQVKIGETIVIGGLISEKERENLMKVPILGDLFLLGKLFQRTEKEKEKTELIITITPRWNQGVMPENVNL